MVQVAESGDEFSVQQFVGEGGFARVFAADWVTGPPHARDVVLKIQMPANTWEWYILSRYSTVQLVQYSTVQYVQYSTVPTMVTGACRPEFSAISPT